MGGSTCSDNESNKRGVHCGGIKSMRGGSPGCLRLVEAGVYPHISRRRWTFTYATCNGTGFSDSAPERGVQLCTSCVLICGLTIEMSFCTESQCFTVHIAFFSRRLAGWIFCNGLSVLALACGLHAKGALVRSLASSR